MSDYLSIPLKERDPARSDFLSSGSYWNREGAGPRFVNQVGNRHGTRYAWIEEDEAAGLRFHGAADTIIRLDHKGWYVAHNNYDETTKGVVYRLPHGRFLAGASDPYQAHKDGSGPFMMLAEVWDDEKEAARAADRFAELWSAEAREDDAQQSAEFQKEELAGEIELAKDSIRKLVAGIRASTVTPPVCAALVNTIRNYRAEITKARKRIAALTKDYWLAVE